MVSLFLQVGVLAVPYLREVFGVVVLTTADWAILFAISLVPLLAVEVKKFFIRLEGERGGKHEIS